MANENRDENHEHDKQGRLRKTDAEPALLADSQNLFFKDEDGFAFAQVRIRCGTGNDSGERGFQV